MTANGATICLLVCYSISSAFQQ